MKMIYHQRDKIRNRKKRWITGSILAACVVFLILANRFFPHFFSPLAHTVGIPMLESRGVIAQTFGSLFGIVHSKRALVEENTNLRQQVILTNTIQAERDMLKSENQTLKNLLGRSSAGDPGIVAHVLAKPGFSPYDTLIVDAGTQENVHSGDLVLVDESVAIGEITSTDAHSSNILLYSAPEQKNNVFVGSKSLETTAIGQGGGVFEIRLPKNSGVVVGDQVMLVQFPDKLFGSVTQIIDTATDSFERVLFRSAVDIDEISYVTIHKHEIPASTNHH